MSNHLALFCLLFKLQCPSQNQFVAPHPPTIPCTNPSKQKSIVPHEKLKPNKDKHEDSHSKIKEIERLLFPFP
jgi:hypothetical protein